MRAMQLKFQRKIDIVFNKMFEMAMCCTTSAVAREIYDSADRWASTTSAIRLAENNNIILDGALPGAFSNKACLERVIWNDNTVRIFKFSQTDDQNFQRSVMKDIEFCDELKRLNMGVLPNGIVEYIEFNLVTDKPIIGSISRAYLMSVADLKLALPYGTILSIFQRVIGIVNSVHLLGLVINDIKSSNLYFDVLNKVDIADCGSYTCIGELVHEYSTDVMPEDFDGYGSKFFDKLCLVVTCLRLAKLEPPRGSTALIEFVKEMENAPLKDAMLSEIAY